MIQNYSPNYFSPESTIIYYPVTTATIYYSETTTDLIFPNYIPFPGDLVYTSSSADDSNDVIFTSVGYEYTTVILDDLYFTYCVFETEEENNSLIPVYDPHPLISFIYWILYQLRIHITEEFEIIL